MAGAALLPARAPATPSRPRSTRRTSGVLIAVSHEAGTAATLAAMKATHGARTILITAKPGRDRRRHDDRDAARGHAWCHTVGYVSPLLALTAIAGAADADDLHARDRRARSTLRAASPTMARDAARLRAADRHRQRPRRDHRARAGAEDRGGPARPGHAARASRRSCTATCPRRTRAPASSSSASTRRAGHSATSAPGDVQAAVARARHARRSRSTSCPRATRCSRARSRCSC